MMRSLLPGLLFLLLLLLLYGCVQPANYCDLPADCTRLNLVHGACVGEWECASNACNWQCDQEVIRKQEKSVYNIDDRINDTSVRDNQTLVSKGDERIFMTRAICLEYGGFWNECVSACRGDKAADYCISVCETVCMCGTQEEFTCPPGYRCKEYDASTQEGECVAI